MPKKKDNHPSIRLYLLIFLTACLILSLYIIENYLNTKKELNRIEKVTSQGGEILVKKDPNSKNELPDFIEIQQWDLPEGSDNEYFDRMEVPGVRVVSTGNISTEEIKGWAGLEKIAKVTTLEVTLDDELGEASSAGPFRVVIKLFPSDQENRNIVPNFLQNIVYSAELDSMVTEYQKKGLSEQDIVNEVNRRLAELDFDYILENDLEKYFQKGTKLMIIPVDEKINKNFPLDTDNPDIKSYYEMLKEYQAITGKYYFGKDDDVIEKIVAENYSAIKQPIILEDMYLIGR
jgi:hypothetical protein